MQGKLYNSYIVSKCTDLAVDEQENMSVLIKRMRKGRTVSLPSCQYLARQSVHRGGVRNDGTNLDVQHVKKHDELVQPRHLHQTAKPDETAFIVASVMNYPLPPCTHCNLVSDLLDCPCLVVDVNSESC
jgi:hypothetical protein